MINEEEEELVGIENLSDEEDMEVGEGEEEAHADKQRLQPRIPTAELHESVARFQFEHNIVGSVVLKLFDVSREQFKKAGVQYRAYVRVQRRDTPQAPRRPGRQNNQDRHLNRRR